MTSGAREVLKWLAVLLMTGDHLAKVFFGGYVPVVSELGRIAFPVFAVVMAYNLAQPGADIWKSVRRLALWAAIAQPAHALAFGYWLPLNVLASFALAAAVVWSIRGRRWWTLLILAGPAPLLVDYQWAGIAVVVSSWWWFGSRPRFGPVWVLLAFCALCGYNGNACALLALPVLALGNLRWNVPRSRWAFYGYYVGHLSLLASLGRSMTIDYLFLFGASLLLALVLAGIVITLRTILWVNRQLRDYDSRPPAP